MDSKPTNFGSFLPVPCVQELVKAKEKPLTIVPPRYVRPDQDPPFVFNTTSLPQVPVIDMLKFLSGDLVDFDSELEKLQHACKEWGFFQLINHGVSTLLVEKLKVEIQAFFNLPMEEKKKYWQQPGVIEGFGQHFVVSEEQKLNWADLFFIITQPAHLRKPHLFPQLPLPFRDTLEAYSANLKDLAIKILNLMGKALGMEANEMTDLFEEGSQSMRMNYYPPCPQPDLVIGLNPHSDAAALTILLQLNEMEGLQVKKYGKWIPIKPLPDAFVVNVGDALEIITNGIYRSIEHRAIVNSEKERLSIATFYNPRLKGEIGPAPSLVKPETPAMYKRIGVADYYKGFFSREGTGISNIDAMRVQNENTKSN